MLNQLILEKEVLDEINMQKSEKPYEYIDGNGNKYIIHNEPNRSIEYFPVKPHLSSSGIYDGGNYTKKEITSQELEDLILILDKAIKNKKSHIPNRVKTSGIIIFQEKNKKKTCILGPGSRELYEIEKFLRDVIEN